MGTVAKRDVINFDESEYLLGLCPHCRQPITLSLVHGGKLSPNRRRLDCRHAFSGNVQCERKEVREHVAAMTGQEKADFFAMRHDLEVMGAMSLEYQNEQMAKMWPGRTQGLFDGVRKFVRKAAQALAGKMPALPGVMVASLLLTGCASGPFRAPGEDQYENQHKPLPAPVFPAPGQI